VEEDGVDDTNDLRRATAALMASLRDVITGWQVRSKRHVLRELNTLCLL
jgi:hypothetical protein